MKIANFYNWTASSEFGTFRLCEQRRFRRACASAQSRQNLRCSLIQVVSQEEPSDRKPDPWPLWMAGHAQLKFVMTECSKTQIRLTGLNYLLSQVMGLWYLSHRQTAKAEVSLHICAVSPEPSLFAQMKYVSRQRVSKSQTSSPSGWLHMRVWRMSLQRMKSAIISWAGSVDAL